jgi:hypothetical protein
LALFAGTAVNNSTANVQCVNRASHPADDLWGQQPEPAIFSTENERADEGSNPIAQLTSPADSKGFVIRRSDTEDSVIVRAAVALDLRRKMKEQYYKKSRRRPVVAWKHTKHQSLGTRHE